MSLGAEFFDDFYGGGDDPWGFETRWYEARKRAITLASLPRERFASALELGCSIGVLTEALAGRVDALLATDIAAAPLERATRRLRASPHVRFARARLPQDWPAGSFDLIVASEVGYYLDTDDLARLLERIAASLAPGGAVVACHWRHPVAEYPLTGDEVVAAFRAMPGMECTVSHVERDFVLEVFERTPARSVAQASGLAS